MKRVLFVCTGNLCRSPMAAVLLRHRLAEAGLEGQVEVESAGTWVLEGKPASGLARALMAERGLSLEGHRTAAMSEAALSRADVVLVMEEEHRKWLFHLAPKHLHKVFLLSELSGGHQGVDDPYGGTRAEYQQTADELERLIEAGLPRLLRELGLTPRAAAGTSGA